VADLTCRSTAKLSVPAFAKSDSVTVASCSEALNPARTQAVSPAYFLFATWGKSTLDRRIYGRCTPRLPLSAAPWSRSRASGGSGIHRPRAHAVATGVEAPLASPRWTSSQISPSSCCTRSATAMLRPMNCLASSPGRSAKRIEDDATASGPEREHQIRIHDSFVSIDHEIRENQAK